MSAVELLLAFGLYGGITAVLNALFARRSQLDTWAEAHPQRAGALKLLRAIGLDPWLIAQALSLWANKRLPEAVRQASIGPPVTETPPVVLLPPGLLDVEETTPLPPAP